MCLLLWWWCVPVCVLCSLAGVLARGIVPALSLTKQTGQSLQDGQELQLKTKAASVMNELGLMPPLNLGFYARKLCVPGPACCRKSPLGSHTTKSVAQQSKQAMKSKSTQKQKQKKQKQKRHERNVDVGRHRIAREPQLRPSFPLHLFVQPIPFDQLQGGYNAPLLWLARWVPEAD